MSCLRPLSIADLFTPLLPPVNGALQSYACPTCLAEAELETIGADGDNCTLTLLAMCGARYRLTLTKGTSEVTRLRECQKEYENAAVPEDEARRLWKLVGREDLADDDLGIPPPEWRGADLEDDGP